MFPKVGSRVIKAQLTTSIMKLLRPLVRIMLRYGMPFGTFAELARAVYVEVAEREFVLPGKKQSDSRISVLTGLNRKEVHRLKQLDLVLADESTARYNRAARVISGWMRNSYFQDLDGQPASLPFDDGSDHSFSALVKLYSGDMPARAVLDELLRVEAVSRGEEGVVSLITHAYLPANLDRDKVAILGVDAADLINTISVNLGGSGSGLRFQRKVSYDNVSTEAVAEFKQFSAVDSQLLLEKFDRWLASHDRDENPEMGGSGRKRVGVGIYYFEDDLADPALPEAAKKT